MEDFGNIIFYILAAAVGLIGAIGRKKIKKDKIRAASALIVAEEDIDAPAKEHAFDREPGDLVSDEEVVEELDSVGKDWAGKARRPETNLAGGAYDQPLETNYDDEGVSSLSDMIFASEHSDNDIMASESDIITSADTSDIGSLAAELVSEFDLSKAIIYSEILNRKEYV